MRGERLKIARELRQLSQQDVSDRTNISVKQIWRYESNLNDPTGDVLARLSKALEVSVDYLVGLVDEPTEHVSEDDLTTMERRLIWAVRHGFIVEAIKTVAAISEETNQAVVPSD